MASRSVIPVNWGDSARNAEDITCRLADIALAISAPAHRQAPKEQHYLPYSAAIILSRPTFKARSSWSAFGPPPWASVCLPPPFPPRREQTWLIISPAFTRGSPEVSTTRTVSPTPATRVYPTVFCNRCSKCGQLFCGEINAPDDDCNSVDRFWNKSLNLELLLTCHSSGRYLFSAPSIH